MSKAIDFNNNAIQYRFIDLDLSVTITLEQDDFLFVPGFKSTDAKSHLNIPRDQFAKLFYYSVQHVDIYNNTESNNDYTKIQYAMDSSSWYNASYSNAIVDVSNQILSSSVYQNLKYDYIRFILKEITGNNTTSGLFRNTDKLLQTVVSMDPLFNSQITTIIDTCGTVYSPKQSDSYYNNPTYVLIQSILANDNVIETDNSERRTSLIKTMTANASTFFNNSTAYYALGTVTGQSQYCYFPIYLKTAVGRTAIQFTEYPDYTFYQNAATTYRNIDSIFTTAYQISGTISGVTKYYYPIYLSNIDGTKTAITFSNYSGITFYTSDTVGKDSTSTSPTYTNYTTLASTSTAYYVYGTKLSDTVPRMYFPIYLNTAAGRIPVQFTDASYASYTLHTSYTNYSLLNSTITSNTNSYSIYATYLGSSSQYFDISLNDSVGSAQIRFTDASYSGMTFYTKNTSYETVHNVFFNSTTAYSYFGKVTVGQATSLYYYPVYLNNAAGRSAITFTDDTRIYYTPNSGGNVTNNIIYPSYATAFAAFNTSTQNTQYYIYATKTATTYPQYYLIYTNNTGSLTSIQFKEYPYQTFYYKIGINNCINYDSVSLPDTSAYFVYGTSAFNVGVFGYYYPLYTSNTAPNTFSVTFTDSSHNGLVMYSPTSTPGFIRRYEDFASTTYSTITTTPYYINGTKTGTTSPLNYFPIYVNYPGHLCSTPITFDQYPNNIFYTNYEQINSQFYPFTFDYGDSLSVRITYKPKYNTYLGKEVNDYSYEVYLDMGLETEYDVSYNTKGDENTTDINVAQITYSGSKVYTALGQGSKVFHYVLQNTQLALSDLYTSPYNFYPTLNDILNVSFDTLNPVLGTKWYFSIFCRPRAFSSDVYDEIGFDRFNSENTVSLVNTWTSYNINNLTWTNGTITGLSWANVLALDIDATTTPYGYIKTNGQQQIMVLAFGTDSTTCAASIRNISVVFKDGRTITMN